ncbi:hypothetical protein ACXGQW_06280 [Wenyingzhuangia sp. IMCC45533]
MKRNLKLLLLPLLVLSICLTVICCGPKEPIATYTVDAKTNKSYIVSINGEPIGKNPTLTLKRGETYEFNVVAYGHPFFIKTKKSVGKSDTYDKGVTNNGANESVLLFSIPKDAPDVLYYVCQYHKMMSGEIKIVD